MKMKLKSIKLFTFLILLMFVFVCIGCKSDEVVELNKQIDDLIIENQKIKEENANLQKSIEALNELIDEMTSENENKDSEINSLQDEKNNLKNEVNKLLSDKTNLWQNFNRATEEEKRNLIRLEITKVTNELNKKRKEVKLCDGIEKRIDDIKENIQEFENENEKGKVKK